MASAVAYDYQPEPQIQLRTRTQIQIQPQVELLAQIQFQIQKVYELLKEQWFAFLYALDRTIQSLFGLQVPVYASHVTHVTRLATFMISLSLYSCVFSWTIASQIMMLQLAVGMMAYIETTYYYPQTQLPIFLPMVGTYLTHSYRDEKDRGDIWLNNFLPQMRLLTHIGLLFGVWSFNVFSSSIPLTLACLKTLSQTIQVYPLNGVAINLPTEVMVKWSHSHPQRSLVLRFMRLLNLSLSLRLLFLIVSS